jgi:putative endonuclease
LPKNRETTQSIGLTGEGLALKYLAQKRYTIVETRFRLLRGEIDIIARDGRTLVFIEVKMRTSESYGRPEESVTPAKQAQIRKVALGYLCARRLGEADCRFDVISIRQRGPAEFAIEHFKNAF